MQEAANRNALLDKEVISLRAQLASAKASSNSDLADLQQKYTFSLIINIIILKRLIMFWYRMREEEDASRKVYEDRFRSLSRSMDEINKTNSTLMAEVSL